MSRQRKIAVVYHKATSPKRMRAYRIWNCAEIWKKMGIDVRFVNGPDFPRDVDLIIPHVDLSVMPDEYRPMLESGIPVVNRRVTDIRKRTFSPNLLSHGDDYDGPVIVKTDLNSGGFPENHLAEKSTLAKRLLRIAKKGAAAIMRPEPPGLNRAALIHSDQYPVFSSLHEVPEEVFGNPHLVVEKYLPETDGQYYYLRHYSFFGSKGVVTRLRSESPVVKGSVALDREIVSVDESIVALRRELGFDFGKFDYVVHEGKAVLLDTNITPASRSRTLSPDMRGRYSAIMAAGISQWFPEFESN